MQPDPLPSQEPQAMYPAAPEAPKKFNILAIVLGVVLFFSCLALAGMGIWAYKLNNNWKATQADLTALQGEYESLTAERDQLTTDLSTTTSALDATNAELKKTQSELEQTKTDLSNTQAELEKSKKETSDLRTNMGRAADYVDVLNGFFFKDNSFTQHRRRVDALDDSTLSDLLDAFEKSRNNATWDDYVSYIIETVMDLLR